MGSHSVCVCARSFFGLHFMVGLLLAGLLVESYLYRFGFF